MHGLPGDGARMWPVAAVASALLALVVWWLGFRESSPELARDFEECVEQVQAKALSKGERGALMTKCYAQFAGRRKPGGGYTYYDFMQDRSFDIAGPNPTPEERKQIDRQYMAFLDAQRRAAVSAELAKRRNEQFQADLERARQPGGAPTAFMPRNSSPAIETGNPVPLPEKRPVDRSVDRSRPTYCEEASLTCSWAKLSAAVKNAFASSSRTMP
jgi:hypothetical protein